ncbi:MAG: hypothetical protein ACXAE3_04480 [Candidatus Kariarchaeaceae archaeon]|jgi:alpha-beta hydrolase superfamily lysophospholipase
MKPVLERSEKNRGDLYKDHMYQPTAFEADTDLYLMHHSDGGITEVLHSKPSGDKKTTDIVYLMVPGFITILDSWEIFLQGIREHFEIYYWETREKGTFHPPNGKPRREHFTPERFLLDLQEFVETSGLSERKYILAGSSFGGTLMIDALSQQLLTPHEAYLIGANIHFRVPYIGKVFAQIFPPGFLSRLKFLVRWYLRNFEVDRTTDEAQYQKYVKATELANFSHIKHTVLNYHPHPQEHLLKEIKVPTVVVGAVADKMHTIEESEFTTGEIENAELASFETNKATHSEPFIEYTLQRYGLL